MMFGGRNNQQQQQKQRQWSSFIMSGKQIIISSFLLLLIQIQLVRQNNNNFVTARAVLGVDLGSLYMKVALVQSGSPLEIVTNLHSKRKTEQLVLFDNDSRFYGADAAALLARKSHITPAAMSVMLGRDENHPTVQVCINNPI
jgi:Hsp70 protein